MLPACRNAARRKFTSYVTERLPPTTREPLYFLYPRWFSAAVDTSTRPGNCTPETPITIARPANDVGEPSKFSTTEGSISGIIRQDTLSAETGPSSSNHQLRTLKETQVLTEGHHSGPSRRQPTVVGVSSNGSPSSLIRRIEIKGRARASRKAYNRAVRHEYRDHRAAETGASLPSWRDVLSTLVKHTATRSETWHDDVARIRIPAHAARHFIFSQDENIWGMKSEYGCEIAFSEAEETSEESRVLLLSGPATNVAKAATKIFQIIQGASSDGDLRHQYLWGFNTRGPDKNMAFSSRSASIIRPVLATDRQRMTAPKRVDTIERPSKWTAASFGMYVQHLTSIKMSSHVHKTLYKPAERHEDMVIAILQAIFADPECKEAISNVALNEALSYLAKHNNIKALRELFVGAEMQEVKMNTETFNIMLRHAAKLQDIPRFSFILTMMLSRGHTPGGGTWLAFMMALDSFEIKLHVLASMREKNLLDKALNRLVCEQMVNHEIEASLDQEMSHAQFLQHMTSRYGKDWLTVSSGNRILDALGSRGLISRCWEMLELMGNQGVASTPDSTSVNTVLTHCEKQANTDGGIKIIHRMTSANLFKPDELTYKKLFDIAWNFQLYNVARVVWIYACLDAKTSFLMRQRVSKSLKLALASPDSVAAKHEVWNATVGSFILGTTAPSVSTMPKGFPEFNPTLELPTLGAHQLSEPHKGQLESSQPTKQAVESAIHNNLQLFKKWSPQRPFADVLLEAYEVDKEWKSRVHKADGQAIDLEWLLRNAPAIPLHTWLVDEESSYVVEWK
jgi:hypothetical protein